MPGETSTGKSSILVKGGNLLLPDFSVKQADMYCEDGRIIEIASPGKLGNEADFILNVQNKLVMPGLVNLHTHSPMNIMRGISDDKYLMDWLAGIWKVEKNLTPELIYWGSKLAILEMIKTGTTAFLDMYWDLDQTAKAAQEFGMRAFLAWAVISPDAVAQSGDPLKNAEHFVREFSKGKPLVKPGVGPHAVYTCNDEMLIKSKEIADKYKTFLHMHLSETRTENEQHLKKTGKRPTQYLEDLGILGPNSIMAHCVWLTKGEIGILAKHDVKVAHNPISNCKLATGGFMPWPEMKEAGLTVGLGTDSVVSNNNLDMFEEMKFAAVMHKAHRWDPTIMNARDALNMAIYEGAKALGLEYGLREGGMADFITLDLKAISMVPRINLVSNIVYSANGGVVQDVVIAGKPVMMSREVQGEREVMEKLPELEETVRDFLS